MTVKDFLMPCDSRTHIMLIDDECNVIELERPYDLPEEYNNYKVWRFNAYGDFKIALDITNKR